jgi:hypothetical protein
MLPYITMRGSEHGVGTPYPTNSGPGPGDRVIAEIEFHPDEEKVIVKRVPKLTI